MIRLVFAAALIAASCGHEPTASELVAAGDQLLLPESVDAARTAAVKYREALAKASDVATQAQIHARLAEACRIGEYSCFGTEHEAVIRLAPGSEQALISRAWLASTEPADKREVAQRAVADEARAAGHRRAEALARSQLAETLVVFRRIPESIQTAEEAVKLAAGDPYLEGYAEYKLGQAIYATGEREKCLAHLQRAFEIAGRAHLPLEQADIASDLGALYHWLYDDPASALVYWSRAEAGLAAIGHSGRARMLNARSGFANLLGSMGRADQALAVIEQAVADGRAIRDDDPTYPAHATLVSLLLSLGSANMGRGNTAQAIAAFSEAAPLASELGDVHAFFLSIFGAADAAAIEQRWADVETLLQPGLKYIAEKAAEATDENMRLAFSAASRNAQERLVESALGVGDPARAFGASERMRAGRLLAALGTGAFVDGAGAQALLDADTAIVEYTFVKKSVIAFVVDRESTRAISLGDRKTVATEALTWYTLASDPAADPKLLDGATRKLAALVLAPLVPTLHSRRLVIVPDKGLHYVAFAALPLPDSKLLAERYELVHAPSASVIQALRARVPTRSAPTRELAVLADPIFDSSDVRLGGATPPAPTMAVRGTSLVRLAATHLEAQSIARLLPPAQVFLAEGKDATPTVALGPEVSSARYVHFATHAILDNVDPDRSGLAFSHVGGDGFVRVPEIEKSHLAAGLVVLSACRTAIGKRFDGEGLVGLTRAFLVAGVPRVVSSLWQVDDAATAELMAQFYRGLIVDKLAPAAALRRAQLDAARKAPPRLWAGFAFYGDWR